jgi:hypothetical protein
VDDFIKIPHNDSLDFNKNEPHSVSVWFYALNSVQDGSVMEKWNEVASYPYVICYQSGRIVFGRYDGASGELFSHVSF